MGLEFELTLYNILSPATLRHSRKTRNSDQGKAWETNTPGAQEAEGDIQKLTPTPEKNTQGLRGQMQNGNEVKHMSTNIRFTILTIRILVDRF